MMVFLKLSREQNKPRRTKRQYLFYKRQTVKLSANLGNTTLMEEEKDYSEKTLSH